MCFKKSTNLFNAYDTCDILQKKTSLLEMECHSTRYSLMKILKVVFFFYEMNILQFTIMLYLDYIICEWYRTDRSELEINFK